MIETVPAARLRRYPPGLHQPAHAHDAAHLSLVVAGGFEETGPQGEVEARAGQTGLRPEGLRHGVRFGPAGAVVLNFVPPTPGDGLPAIIDPDWSPRLSRDHLRRLTPLMLEGGEAAVEAGWDLLALSRPPVHPRRADPWLREVHDRLLETPADVRLTDLARRAGRHRVHLGRAFLAAFGETPSAFRRRAMVDAGLCLLARGLPAARAAAEAGFFDQSHFSRACRDLHGLPPGRIVAPPA